MSETEYQPRTTDRLIEILLAQGENLRSWQFEAAEQLSNLKWRSENKDAALKEAMAEVGRLERRIVVLEKVIHEELYACGCQDDANEMIADEINERLGHR